MVWSPMQPAMVIPATQVRAEHAHLNGNSVSCHLAAGMPSSNSRGVVGEDSDDSYFVGSDVERCADPAAFLKPHCLEWQVQVVNFLTSPCVLQ